VGINIEMHKPSCLAINDFNSSLENSFIVFISLPLPVGSPHVTEFTRTHIPLL
jgi:hypothetical protein